MPISRSFCMCLSFSFPIFAQHSTDFSRLIVAQKPGELYRSQRVLEYKILQSVAKKHHHVGELFASFLVVTWTSRSYLDVYVTRGIAVPSPIDRTVEQIAKVDKES
ncbi:hypothetical protein HDK77DRAFT_5566 [Phyllosticta capitalensis]